MKTWIATLLLTLSPAAFAGTTMDGYDNMNELCTVHIDDQNPVLLDGAPAQELTISFTGIRYRNVIAKRTAEGFEFDLLMMKSGGGYTRVIGAPITIGGIGLLQLKGQVNLQTNVMKVSAQGLKLFSNWKRADVCEELHVIQPN